MKKYLLSLCALALAVGFSAFTPPSKAFVDRFYLDETGWHTIDASLTCPEGTRFDCVVEVNGTPRQIYKSQNVTDPLKYN